MWLVAFVTLVFPKLICASNIEHHLDLDLRLMTQLKSYSEDLQDHISVLNRYVDERRSKLAKVGTDPEEYLGNPLNSFSLLHHMHFDWPIWRRLMEQPLASEQVAEMRELLNQIPSRYEYKDSIGEAIHYRKTQTEDEVEYDSRLSPLESLELAQYAFDQEDYDQAEDWLNRTLEGYQNLNYPQKELYGVLTPVSESQVQDLYDKVKEIKRKAK